MRTPRLGACLAVALLLGACQSQGKRTEQARDAARSWIAGINLTCRDWRDGRVPARFARRAIREARQQLEKSIVPLPATERARTLAAAAAADCGSAGTARP